MRRSIPERHEADWKPYNGDLPDPGPTNVELRYIVASIVLMLFVLLLVIFLVNTLNPGPTPVPTVTPTTYGFPPTGTIGG